MSEEADIKQHFIKQRRNLIVISLLVLFAELLGIQVEKINFFGIESKLNNPHLIKPILWVALIYWFIRYTQYLHDLGERGFKKEFFKKMDAIIARKAFKKKINSDEFKKKLSVGNDMKERKFSLVSYYDVRRKLKLYGLVLRIAHHDYYGSGSTYDERETITETKEFILPAIRSIVYVILSTRLFTEYVLPYIIFLCPVVYKIYNLWTCG